MGEHFHTSEKATVVVNPELILIVTSGLSVIK